ncbi:MAG: hypothetical protein JKX92_12230 [Porticoccaceae bacterium]|nr:hypothetical protein [Porticoccaceae bacterium]
MSKNTANTSHHFAGLDDWFPVFRSGEHVDSQGRKQAFTHADLDSVIANHNNAEPAPFVVGHPKHNDPAYAWTAGLKRDGDTLLAKGKDIVSEFGDAVKNKLYPNRSISIAPDGNGGWALRHIGFLGGVAPAVKGLGAIAFHSNDDTREFAIHASHFAMTEAQQYATSRGLRTVGDLFRSMREWLIQEKNIETADQVIPGWEVDSLRSTADDLREHAASFSEHSMDKDVMTVSTDNTDRQFSQTDIDTAVQNALLTERESTTAREAELLFQARHRDAIALIDNAVTDGRLLPAQTPGLAEFMASLLTDDNDAFEFSVGDGDKKTKATKTPAKFISDFVASLGKQITLGADDTSGPDEHSKSANFSTPAGAVVDEDRLALHNKALDYQVQNKCDYVTALTAVEGE